MASIAQLRAKLTFDDAQFNQGIKRSTDKAAKFAGQLRSFLASGAIVSGVRSIADQFDRIGKLGKRFDVAPESLQRLGQAAELAGADLETVAKGMNSLTNNLAEAISGSEEYAEAFGQLNIELESFRSLSPDKQMQALSRAVSEATDAQMANAAAMKILGTRAGAELLPLLRDYEGLTKSISETPVVSAEQIAAIEAFNDSITRLKTELTAAAGTALGGFLEKLDLVRDSLTAVVEMFGAFYRGASGGGGLQGGAQSAERALGQQERSPEEIQQGLSMFLRSALPFGLGSYAEVAGRGLGVIPELPASATGGEDGASRIVQKLDSIDRTLKEQSDTNF